MMEKVFVTGAEGMLGSSICRQLTAQGYAVKALCFDNRVQDTLSGLSLEKAKGDVLNKACILKEMEGCDYVIHAAALTHVYPKRNATVYKVNMEGTKNVMEAAEKLNITRMVHIGSASSFGCGTKEAPGTETTAFTGWKYGMDYIDSKYMAQKLLLEKHASSGFPVIIINPTFMIGPFDSAPSSGQMLLSLYKNKIPGYSGGGKNFVCSVDVAVAAVNALRQGSLGQCYIAGNENLEFCEFFKKAAYTMNKKFTLKRMPQPLILLAGSFGSLLASVTGKPPGISYGVAKLAAVKQYFSSDKTVRELNMPQTPIEVGIKQCMDWFAANGYLK